MADATIGALRIVLGADSAAFEKQMKGISSRLEGIGKQISGAAAGLTSFLSAGVIKDFAVGAVTAFGDSQKAIAAVNAALSSMGNRVGFTSDQLANMAAQLQQVTTFDDDQILAKVTANLLTFGNVSGKVFEDAQKLALDLSERLGQDLQSSTIMLGKALNDPIEGLTALRRVGIQFSASQEAMIKSMVKAGKIAKAQGIMEQELFRQFGGQAEAAAKTVTGAWEQASNAIGDAMEAIGQALAPTALKLAQWVKSTAEAFTDLDPAVQKIVVGFGLVAFAIPPLSLGAAAFVMALRPLAPLLIAVTAAAWDAVVALAAFAIANPLIAGLALLAGGVAYFALRQTDAERAAEAHKTALDNLTTALDHLKAGVPGAAKELKSVEEQNYANAKSALEAARAQVFSIQQQIAAAEEQRSAYAQLGMLGASFLPLFNEAELQVNKQRLQSTLDLVTQLETNLNDVVAKNKEAEAEARNLGRTVSGVGAAGDRDLHGWNERFAANVKFVGEADEAWNTLHVRIPPVTAAVNDAIQAVDSLSTATSQVKPIPAIVTPSVAEPSAVPQISQADQLRSQFDILTAQIKASVDALWVGIKEQFSQGQNDVVSVASLFATSVGAELAKIGTAADGLTTNQMTNLIAKMWEVQDQGELAFVKLYDAANQWLVGALGRAIDATMTKISELIDRFQLMYDKVVGHSYIPDMVTESTGWLKKMGTSMDTIGGGAVDRWNSNISSMSAASGSLSSREAASVRAANDNAGSMGRGRGDIYLGGITIQATDYASFKQAKGQVQSDLANSVRAALAGR